MGNCLPVSANVGCAGGMDAWRASVVVLVENDVAELSGPFAWCGKELGDLVGHTRGAECVPVCYTQ